MDVLVKLDNARTYLLREVLAAADCNLSANAPATRSFRCSLRPQAQAQARAQSAAVLSALSAASGFPLCILRPVGDWDSALLPVVSTARDGAISASVPYLSASTHLPLLGGKGGFGTLLKGQSKQAGAKTTLDFGACRDLSGRRLRHVNDEVKLRKWRDAQRRRAAGLPVDELAELKTPSGIRNWHLMVPGWSDSAAMSNKGRRKNERIMRREVDRWTSEEERKRMRVQRKQEEHERGVAEYVRAGISTEEEDEGGSSKKDAILRAMKKKRAAMATAEKGKRPPSEAKLAPEPAAAASSVKRKFDEVDDENDASVKNALDDGTPSFLCVLSGDASVSDVSENSSAGSTTIKKLAIQSRSEFATVAVLLDRPTSSASSAPAADSCTPKEESGESRGMYYEVTIRTAGLAQVGWASAGGPSTSADTASRFSPNSDAGDGVGDDSASWGYDGSRGMKFHAGKEDIYSDGGGSDGADGGAADNNPRWKDGDVLGCAYLPSGEVRYYLNGQSLGEAFALSRNDDGGAPPRLTPSLSLNGGEEMCLNVGPLFEHSVPEGCGGACEWLDLTSNDDDGDLQLKEGGGAKDDGAKKRLPTEEGKNASSDAGGPSGDGPSSVAVPPPAVRAFGGESTIPDTPAANKKVVDATEKGKAPNASVETKKPECGSKQPELEPKKTPPPSFDPFTFNLESCSSPSELEALGMNNLKFLSASMGLKAGGTLGERAKRIWSVKGIKREDYPKKVRAKGFAV